MAEPKQPIDETPTMVDFSTTVTAVTGPTGTPPKVTRCPCGGPIMYPRDENGRYRCGTCDARHTLKSLGLA